LLAVASWSCKYNATGATDCNERNLPLDQFLPLFPHLPCLLSDRQGQTDPEQQSGTQQDKW